MKKKNIILISVIFIIIVILVLLFVKLNFGKENNNMIKPPDNNGTTLDFDYKIIKKVNEKYKGNYLVSPLSIAYALSMLNDGASDKTKEEINNLIKDYKFSKIPNVKNRINIANALFIKNRFKNEINESYVNHIKSNYNADTIYDEFNSPDKLNNWVKDKTHNMIPKLVDRLDPNFVLGIVNALAIDVEWNNKFKCENTKNGEFNLINGSKMDTAYMHQSEGNTYFETNNAKGIIKSYETYKNDNNESIDLEYIAILPNNIDEYINNFNLDELHKIYNSTITDNVKVNLAIPKYTYDFNYDNFKADLISLGIKEAFDEKNASFKNITNNNDVYVYDAIHKTHIDLSENGTKAAAVTAFLIAYKSAIDNRNVIDITFDRPFVYIIKEKNNDNIWFFGTVYEPIKYENSTCKTKEK